MIRRLKKALGIESIKIEFDVPVEHDMHSEHIAGELLFTTKISQEVDYVNVKLIETYHRGRRKNKRIDDYLLGEWESEESFYVDKNTIHRIPFKLTFEYLESGMDRFQSKNPLFKSIGSLAKIAKKAKSEYTLVAEANAIGTALNPMTEKEIYLI